MDEKLSSDRSDTDDELSETAVESTVKNVKLSDDSDESDESNYKGSGVTRQVFLNEFFKSLIPKSRSRRGIRLNSLTPSMPDYDQQSTSVSCNKEKENSTSADKLNANAINARKRFSEIADNGPFKRSFIRSSVKNKNIPENGLKMNEKKSKPLPNYNDCMSASTSFGSPSSPDQPRNNHSANHRFNEDITYNHNMKSKTTTSLIPDYDQQGASTSFDVKEKNISTSADKLNTKPPPTYDESVSQSFDSPSSPGLSSNSEDQEVLNDFFYNFTPNTYQLDYMKMKIITYLINSKHLCTKSLTNILCQLIDGTYQTFRQCANGINKLFMKTYLELLQKNSFDSRLLKIGQTQDVYHELVAKMEWNSTEKINESKYHPISKLAGSGNLTMSQTSHLTNIVLNLQDHQYSYLLRRSNDDNMEEIAGTSSSDVSRNAYITLEIIQDRLLSGLYSSVEECLQDIDELFMDSFIFEFSAESLFQTHFLYTFFRGQIIHISKYVVAKEDYFENFDEDVEEQDNCSETVSQNIENDESEDFVGYFLNVIDSLLALPLTAISLKDYTVFCKLINFSEITQRLQSNYYTTPYQCCEDFDKLFHNGLQAQKDDPDFYSKAMKLKKAYDEAKKKFFDQLKKRDS